MPKAGGGGSRKEPRAAAAGPAADDETQVLGPGLTGSYLVLLSEERDERRAGLEALRSIAGLKVAHSRDFAKKPVMAAFEEATRRRIRSRR